MAFFDAIKGVSPSGSRRSLLLLSGRFPRRTGIDGARNQGYQRWPCWWSWKFDGCQWWIVLAFLWSHCITSHVFLRQSGGHDGMPLLYYHSHRLCILNIQVQVTAVIFHRIRIPEVCHVSDTGSESNPIMLTTSPNTIKSGYMSIRQFLSIEFLKLLG